MTYSLDGGDYSYNAIIGYLLFNTLLYLYSVFLVFLQYRRGAGLLLFILILVLGFLIAVVTYPIWICALKVVAGSFNVSNRVLGVVMS